MIRLIYCCGSRQRAWNVFVDTSNNKSRAFDLLWKKQEGLTVLGNPSACLSWLFFVCFSFHALKKKFTEERQIASTLVWFQEKSWIFFFCSIFNGIIFFKTLRKFEQCSEYDYELWLWILFSVYFVLLFVFARNSSLIIFPKAFLSTCVLKKCIWLCR